MRAFLQSSADLAAPAPGDPASAQVALFKPDEPRA